jgi:hypothetical protein
MKMDESRRSKWIAVLVLVVAGGLFGRSMVHQIAANNDDRLAAKDEAVSETVSTAGLYGLHTQCAQECRERGDVSGAIWHERILARMRGEAVDDSVILEDAGEVDAPQGVETASRPNRSLEDPTHPHPLTARVETVGSFDR